MKSLTKQSDKAKDWAGNLKGRQFRPRVAFASEVNGQTVQMIMNLGEAANSKNGRTHWILQDLTMPTTWGQYHGYSRSWGLFGHAEAIRNAFVDFRENGEYGRGSIAIELPDELGVTIGGPVGLEPVMRERLPGPRRGS